MVHYSCECAIKRICIINLIKQVFGVTTQLNERKVKLVKFFSMYLKNTVSTVSIMFDDDA